MTTLLITNNATRENGQFMGDQLCFLKIAYLMVRNCHGIDKVIMSMSPNNEMHFLWTKFLENPAGDGSLSPVDVVYDTLNPGDNEARWVMWDKWRSERVVEGRPFDHYRELYLRIHGAQRQRVLCGSERGLGRFNIYEYMFFGQENIPDQPPKDVNEWVNHGIKTTYSYGSDLIYHPTHTPKRDVYISPHAKTQGNVTFTFDFWSEVVHKLLENDVSVTVGYNGYFCEDLNNHPLYKKYWGDHKQWMNEVCQHKLVVCGNTGTGWLAAACGIPMVTMEPHNSQMPDHRYRECGLRNLVKVVDTPDADLVAKIITNEVQKCVVMTTGCYDVIHAGHIRHLERSRALGTKLIVALNSDSSVKLLKGQERPVNPENQRKAVLEALRCVDEVRLFDGPNALDLIKEVKPDVLTAGFGYAPDKIVGKELVEGRGGRVKVTCASDASNEPSTTNILKRVRAADIIEICRIASGSSINPYDKLKLAADTALSVRHLDGDVADLGAYRGGMSLILRRLLPDKRLYIFDTWKGTPYDDPLCHHKKGEWATTLEECKALVGNSELTNYLEGEFPNTSAGLEHNNFCFVYVDMDTEKATTDALAFFWPRMVAGGKIMVDDWGWNPCAGVEKAVRAQFSEDQLQIVPGLHTCIIEKR